MANTTANQQDWSDSVISLDLLPARPRTYTDEILISLREPGDFQRYVITDRSRGSPYKIRALLKSCVHGTLRNNGPPASLIVVEYTAQVAKEGVIFKEITTSFEFRASSPKTRDPSVAKTKNPSVVAFSPFAQEMRWNETDVTETRTGTLGCELAPEVGGVSVGSVSANRQKGSEWVQRSFDRGFGIKHYGSYDRADGVEWTLLANRRQKMGVAPRFRVAMLVERDGDGPFEAHFTIGAKGGFGYIWAALGNRFIRRTANDRPIKFSPQMEPVGDKIEGVVIDKDNLQTLVQGEELRGLGGV